MWSFGQTVFDARELAKDVIFGEASGYAEALDVLYEHVEKMASDAKECDQSGYAVILADMRNQKDDPGIRFDPDQWEDEEFMDNSGHLVFFVYED